MNQTSQKAPIIMVVLAFVIVYIVWGSTYYFIQQALSGFPPFILGAVRFMIAGMIMFGWCLYKGEKLFDWYLIPRAALGGLLMLFVGNGMVIWVEQTLPSAMAAIMVSSAPLWFVLLDKPKWRQNLTDPRIILGLLAGFVGVVLLFGDKLFGGKISIGTHKEILGLALLKIGIISWAAGSLYIKYNVKKVSAVVNTSWQIMVAGLAFVPGIFITGEWRGFHWSDVTPWAWISLWYLIIMGSIAAFSAYVWLLQVRPATQVSTYAYVNPLVAVILGVLFAGEKISFAALAGLAIILGSVLMINLKKAREEKK